MGLAILLSIVHTGRRTGRDRTGRNGTERGNKRGLRCGCSDGVLSRFAVVLSLFLSLCTELERISGCSYILQLHFAVTFLLSVLCDDTQ